MLRKIILVLIFSIISHTGLPSLSFAGPAIPLKTVSLTSIGGVFFKVGDWEIETVNAFAVKYLCTGDDCDFTIKNRNFSSTLSWTCEEEAVVAISQNVVHIPANCSDD